MGSVTQAPQQYHRRAHQSPLSPPPLDGLRQPDGSAMHIDPDDDTFRQSFDAWPARPNIWYRVFAVTTRSRDVEDYPRFIPVY